MLRRAFGATKPWCAGCRRISSRPIGTHGASCPNYRLHRRPCHRCDRIRYPAQPLRGVSELEAIQGSVLVRAPGVRVRPAKSPYRHRPSSNVLSRRAVVSPGAFDDGRNATRKKQCPVLGLLSTRLDELFCVLLAIANAQAERSMSVTPKDISEITSDNGVTPCDAR